MKHIFRPLYQKFTSIFYLVVGLLSWLIASEALCATTMAASASATGARQIIVLGELHGTWESPGFTQGLVAAAIDRGQKVLLGIESDGEFANEVNSISTEQDCDHLLKLRFWTKPIASQDGRSSEAMAKLWCWAVEYSNKSELGVMGLDLQRPDVSLNEFRRRVERLNPDLVVFLVGNWHARKEGETSAKHSFIDLVSASVPNFTVRRFFMAAASGSAWNCRSNCGVQLAAGLPQLAPKVPSSNGLYLWKVLDAENGLRSVPSMLLERYDGIYWFEHVSSSSPMSISK